MSLLPMELWNDREPREKVLLVALFLFLIGVVFYMLVYQPLYNQYQQAQMDYRQSTDDYRLVRSQIATIAELKRNALGADLVMGGLDKLRTEIDQSIKKHKLTAEVAILDEEEGGKLVEIKFNDAEGRKVMKWLEENIRSGHLLHAFDLSHQGSGNVSATAYFTLTQPPS